MVMNYVCDTDLALMCCAWIKRLFGVSDTLQPQLEMKADEH